MTNALELIRLFQTSLMTFYQFFILVEMLEIHILVPIDILENSRKFEQGSSLIATRQVPVRSDLREAK